MKKEFNSKKLPHLVSPVHKHSNKCLFRTCFRLQNSEWVYIYKKIQFTSLNIKCRLFGLYSVEYRLQGLANDWSLFLIRFHAATKQMRVIAWMFPLSIHVWCTYSQHPRRSGPLGSRSEPWPSLWSPPAWRTRSPANRPWVHELLNRWANPFLWHTW